MGDGKDSKGAQYTVVMMVTPEIAAEWLKKNHPRNRAINNERVQEMANEMRAGHWRLTHEGVARTCDGVLVDGQHRLAATVRSGVAVRMSVTENVADDALDAINTGRSRSATDVLRIADGVKIRREARAACIAAHRIITDGTLNRGAYANIHTLRAVMVDHLADYEGAAALIGPSHDRLAQAPLLGALTIMHALHPKETRAFAEAFRAGGLPNTHPAQLLRDFVALRYTPAPAKRDELVEKTVTAVLNFIDGAELDLLRRSPAELTKIVKRWRRAKGRPANAG